MLFIKENKRITNSLYQVLFKVSKCTATYDLQFLVEQKLISKVGSTGKGTNYILQRGNKGATDAVRATMRQYLKSLLKISCLASCPPEIKQLECQLKASNQPLKSPNFVPMVTQIILIAQLAEHPDLNRQGPGFEPAGV